MQAADQYLLEPLKAHCADLIAKKLTPANVLAQYELSRQFNSNKLMHSTMAYIVLEFEGVQVSRSILLHCMHGPVSFETCTYGAGVSCYSTIRTATLQCAPFSDRRVNFCLIPTLAHMLLWLWMRMRMHLSI